MTTPLDIDHSTNWEQLKFHSEENKKGKIKNVWCIEHGPQYGQITTKELMKSIIKKKITYKYITTLVPIRRALSHNHLPLLWLNWSQQASRYTDKGSHFVSNKYKNTPSSLIPSLLCTRIESQNRLLHTFLYMRLAIHIEWHYPIVSLIYYVKDSKDNKTSVMFWGALTSCYKM